MFELSLIVVVLVFVLLIIAALAVALKLIGLSVESATPAEPGTAPAPSGEGEFLESFLKPIYDDGLGEMEAAVDAIMDGLAYYGRGAYVNAGEEFIAARRGMSAAARKFREVQTLVEDPQVDYAKGARSRLDECRRFEGLAKDMESACDAMLDGRQADADVLVDKVDRLKDMAEQWTKDGPAAT